MTDTINKNMPCSHEGVLTADVEGYENITEPMFVRITCQDCERHLTVVIEDVVLRPWEED